MNIQHNRSTKKTLKQYVQKLNKNKPNEEILITVSTTQCIIEPGRTCCLLFIYCSEWCRFDSQCLSNAKRLFSWTLSQKRHVQASFKKGHQDVVLVPFTVTTPSITKAINTRYQISSPFSSEKNVFTTKLCSSFGITHRKNSDVGMKKRALKAKQDCSFWSCGKIRKGF